MQAKTLKLVQKYKSQIDKVCTMVIKTRGAASLIAEDGAEIYGYPRSLDKVAWGVNSAVERFNVLRGIRLSSGVDEGIM